MSYAETLPSLKVSELPILKAVTLTHQYIVSLSSGKYVRSDEDFILEEVYPPISKMLVSITVDR